MSALCFVAITHRSPHSLLYAAFTLGCCGYKLYPLVSICRRLAVNMYLVSATKMSPVCRLSVAGYKGTQVDRDINE